MEQDGITRDMDKKVVVNERAKGENPMKDIRVAFLQIAPTGSLKGNLEKGETYCKLAKEQGADIVLFPEMWSSGYQIPEETEELKALSVSRESAFVRRFQELAK